MELIAAVFTLLALGVAGPRFAAAQSSMVRREARKGRTGRSALQSAVEHVLKGEAAERLLAVEASVRPSYEAFPKNSMGHIPSSEIFPAIVRGYFAKEHGWLIKGLEPPHLAPRPTEVQEALVLQAHAPELVHALRELHDADKGLSLGDVVSTIAAIEHLLLGESQVLLGGAYGLNERSEAEDVDEAGLREVLQSYLLLFRHGHPHNLTDVSGHQKMKERAQRGSTWAELAAFVEDAVHNSKSKAPYTFADAWAIVRALALEYGRWQNSECVQMKTTLVNMGSNGSGDVLFERFNAEPKHASFQFTETTDYLRKTGALDEEDGQPRVRIANYLLGPSNCIASSEHYSVCCLSECEAVMSELEETIQAPVWPVQRMLDLVARTASSSLPAPRSLADNLAQSLEGLAGRHGDAVPLHSAEFRIWLHKAFPNECPLPTAAENAAEENERLAAEDWLALQQECTRVPQWHPSMQAKVVNV